MRFRTLLAKAENARDADPSGYPQNCNEKRLCKYHLTSFTTRFFKGGPDRLKPFSSNGQDYPKLIQFKSR
jgi:hypothetical protein